MISTICSHPWHTPGEGAEPSWDDHISGRVNNNFYPGDLSKFSPSISWMASIEVEVAYVGRDLAVGGHMSIYVLGHDDFFYRFSRNSTRIAFTTLPYIEPVSGITIRGDGVAYFIRRRGYNYFPFTILAVNPQGEVLLDRPITGNILGTIEVDSEGNLYLASPDVGVISLTPEGEFRNITLQEGVPSSPLTVNDGGYVYLLLNNQKAVRTSPAGWPYTIS